MAHYNFLLLIIILGIHNLACLPDDKIACSINKTLLDFVKIYFPIHCHTISILSLYFHVHILCIYTKLHQLREYFMLIIDQSIRQGTITASMFHKMLDDQVYHCFNVLMNNFVTLNTPNNHTVFQ